MHIQLHVVRLRHNPKNSSSEAQFSTSRVKTSVTFTRHKKPHLEKQQKQTALHTSPWKRGGEKGLKKPLNKATSRPRKKEYVPEAQTHTPFTTAHLPPLSTSEEDQTHPEVGQRHSNSNGAETNHVFTILANRFLALSQ
jgi:hypothetical protein